MLVVEQPAADVGAVELRAQQQPRVLEPVGGEHDGAGRDPHALAVRADRLHARRAAVLAQHVRDHRALEQRDAAPGGEGAVVERVQAGVAGVGRAQLAGRPAGARRPRADRGARARLRERPVGREVRADQLVDGGERVRRAGAVRPGDPERELGGLVVRRQLVEAERPVAADPVGRVQPEVVLGEARRHAGPGERGAADAVDVGPRVRARVRVDLVVGLRARAGVLAGAQLLGVRAPGAALDDRDLDARVGQLARDEQPADAGADDHDVGRAVAHRGSMPRVSSGSSVTSSRPT